MPEIMRDITMRLICDMLDQARADQIRRLIDDIRRADPSDIEAVQ